MPPALQIKNMTKSFGGIHAVDHCSFEVEEHSITGLIGPNGAGKTTMFDLASGLLKPDSGHVLLHYDDITSVPVHLRVQSGISRTFQNIRLFPEITVLDNIMVAFPDYPDSLFAVFKKLSPHLHALRRRAMELLETVSLHTHAHALASSLSYGQQKLLEILRCTATGASLLLLDEPAAGVNRTMLHQIITLIKNLQKEGKTILLVEHDIGFVMNLCEKIVVLDFGKNIAEGSPDAIQKNPLVLEAYLGVKKISS